MATQTSARNEWEELLGELAQRAEGDLLDRLLALWCQSTGVDAAVLYDGDGTVREAVARSGAGTDSFPKQLGSEGVSGLGRRELPNGVVLHTGSSSTSASGPLDLLLAQAVEIRRLRQRLRWQNFQQSYRMVELEAVYEVGLAIASTLNLDELSEGILLRAVSLSDARRGALYLLEGEEFRLRGTIGGEARARIARDDPEIGRLLGEDTDVEQDILPGARYTLAVPIEIEGDSKGLVAIGDKEKRRGVGPFLPADRRTLGLFANQAAIALENARLHRQALEKERLEREMELAADIQKRLLPKDVPRLPGYELLGWNRPTWQVGGDYYDFLELEGGRLGLVVGDVTGKGLSAALLVSTLHSALRLLFAGAHLGREVFSRLNEHIVSSSSPNKFITLIFAELDPDRGKLRSVNAGHNPGLLVRSKGPVSELVPGGMPLGLLSRSGYRSQDLSIEPGDLLCLYSDGITECTSPQEEEFGQKRFEELLVRLRERPLDEIVDRIDEEMETFADGSSQYDDQTLVLLRRTA